MVSKQNMLYFLVLGVLVLTALIVSAIGQETVFYVLNLKVGVLLPDVLWKSLTMFGDTLVALALLVPFLLRYPRLSGSVLLTIILTSLWVSMLKDYFAFLRPAAILSTNAFHILGPIYQKGSFPSGHAATIFALAMIVVHNVYKIWLKALLITLAFMVALSRVMVGAHWPFDVIVGAAGGIGAAAFGLAVGRHLHNQHLDRLFPLVLAPTVLALFFYPTPYALRVETFTLGVLLLFCSARPFIALANDARVQWGLFRKVSRL